MSRSLSSWSLTSLQALRQENYPWAYCLSRALRGRSYWSRSLEAVLPQKQEKWKCKSLSRVHSLAIPWIVAHQAPLPMKFSREEYWSGLPFSSLGNLPILYSSFLPDPSTSNLFAGAVGSASKMDLCCVLFSPLCPALSCNLSPGWLLWRQQPMPRSPGLHFCLHQNTHTAWCYHPASLAHSAPAALPFILLLEQVQPSPTNPRAFALAASSAERLFSSNWHKTLSYRSGLTLKKPWLILLSKVTPAPNATTLCHTGFVFLPGLCHSFMSCVHLFISSHFPSPLPSPSSRM